MTRWGIPRLSASTVSTFFLFFGFPFFRVSRNTRKSSSLVTSDRKLAAPSLHCSTLSIHWRLFSSFSASKAPAPAGRCVVAMVDRGRWPGELGRQGLDFRMHLGLSSVKFIGDFPRQPPRPAGRRSRSADRTVEHGNCIRKPGASEPGPLRFRVTDSSN